MSLALLLAEPSLFEAPWGQEALAAVLRTSREQP